MRRSFAFFFLTIISAFPYPRAWSHLYRVREVHYQMGTFLELILYNTDPEKGKKIARTSVQEVHRLETILSHYDSQSSLSRLNRQAGQGKVKVDPELLCLLAASLKFSARTSGYFDVTVGPLVSLWQEAGKKGIIPGNDYLARTLQLVGFRNVALYATGEAELKRKGMKIDLGGIGKGYAVDRILQLLKQAGVTRALINFGGSSIYGLGSPPGEKSWEIGLKGPDGELAGILRLRDRALATSGSMGHYWKIGGKRYGHLINPKNGLPVLKPRVATVVAESATEAEALTKPLILLEKKGLVMLKDFPQVEAALVLEDGELSFSEEFVSTTSFHRSQDR